MIAGKRAPGRALNDGAAGPALHCPACRGPLDAVAHGLACTPCDRRFPGDDGMADFLGGAAPRDAVLAAAERNYGTAAAVETRIGFYRRRFELRVPAREAVERLSRRATDVLEIGCGTLDPLLAVGNRYRSTQRIWGVDASAGMLRQARHNDPRARLARADAAALPFASGGFPLIWARHMLYHVPRPEAVLAEAARLIAADGVFGLSTNSRANKPELHELHGRLAARLGLPAASAPDSRRFAAEEVKDWLAPHFEYVVVLPFKGLFRFESAEEFVRYYLSTVYAESLRQAGAGDDELAALAHEELSGRARWHLSNDGAVALAARHPDCFAEPDLMARAERLG